MYTLLIILHVLFCLFLILVILLQTGKGGGMGAAFGGGGSQTMFGPRGAGSFIGKITGTIAALFMLTSAALAYYASSGSTGIAEKAEALNVERGQEVEEVDLGAESPAQSTPAPAEEPTPVEPAEDGGAATDSGPKAAAPAETPDSGA